VIGKIHNVTGPDHDGNGGGGLLIVACLLGAILGVLLLK